MTKFSSNKLKGKIVEVYGSQQKFAEALGLDASQVSRRLASSTWKAYEIIQAVDLLGIPRDEIDIYFFEPEVAKESL